MTVVDLGNRVPRCMLRAIVYVIIVWRRHHRDRRLLAMLNERELRDIGLDRCMVKKDDGPEFWHRNS